MATYSICYTGPASTYEPAYEIRREGIPCILQTLPSSGKMTFDPTPITRRIILGWLMRFAKFKLPTMGIYTHIYIYSVGIYPTYLFCTAMSDIL